MRFEKGKFNAGASGHFDLDYSSFGFETVPMVLGAYSTSEQPVIICCYSNATLTKVTVGYNAIGTGYVVGAIVLAEVA